jgi:two-component system nitrogen regulation response regulator NtrX
MKRTRVLIVDDELGIRESLAGVLEDEGYSCHAVGSGEECLAALARENYEVVLLDVWLPQMDGMETLARIQ